MGKAVALVLDQGSSSSRALAFDPAGKLVSASQIPLKTYSPRPRQSEHRASELLKGQLAALEGCLQGLPRSASIVGIGLACQRSSVVFWDRKTGSALSPVLSWRDGRASNDGITLNPVSVHQETGLYLTPYYSAPKMRWALSNLPKVRKALASGRLLAGPVSSYLIWHLTRGEVFAVDPSLAQRTLLYDIQKRRWSARLLSAFGVPESLLPELATSVGNWGECATSRGRLPIRVCLGDQQAAFAATAKPMSRLNYGTGAFLMVPAGSTPKAIPGILTSAALQAPSGKLSFFHEGTMNAAATTFTWLKQNFGLLRTAEEIDVLCRASKNPLHALPALGGLGAPRWDYGAPTALLGLKAESTPADIVRGFADGIAQLLTDVAQAITETGVSLGRLRASGGLSQVNYLLQTQSDLLGRPVERVDETETTAIGVARLLFEDAGVRWTRPIRSQRVFRPKLPAASREEKRRRWKRFVSAMQGLRDI